MATYPISRSPGQRQVGIDIVRFLASVGVVCIHASSLSIAGFWTSAGLVAHTDLAPRRVLIQSAEARVLPFWIVGRGRSAGARYENETSQVS